MNKLKRITAMVMVIFTLFTSLSVLTVNAATAGAKTTVDAAYRCYKGSNTGTSGTAPIGNSNYYWHYNTDGTSLNCPIRFMKESGTGLAVYCIEMGATFSGGYTYDTKNLTDSSYWNKLSATAQTGVTYSTMYGYPVNKFGAANCDAYAATQTIIWEFVKGYRNLSGRTNATLYNLMIKDSPAESAYNQLSSALIAHNKRPSFAYSSSSAAANNQITLKYDSASNTWAATLTDANSVLSGYNVTSNGGLSVSKSGNNLVISASSELSGTASIQLARPLPSTGQPLLTLYSSNSQNALIGQLRDPVASYISINTNTEDVSGKVSVNKVGENGDKLSGVVFGIYADSACSSLITTMTTNNGAAVSDDINVSRYPTVYVKERSMSDELSALYTLNPTVYTVRTIRNGTAAVNNGTSVVNEWRSGAVKVVKQNENGGRLKEITFAIYEDEECLTPLLGADGKQVLIITNNDGVALYEGIEVNNNGSRKLYVKEHSISEVHGDKYVLDTTVYPVTVTAGAIAMVNGGEVINKWNDAKLCLYKKNPAGIGINGAEFTIYSDAECTVPLTDSIGETAVIVTDSDGFGVSNYLKVDKDGTLKVFLKETAVDDPTVMLNNDVFEVMLLAGETVEYGNGEPIIDRWKPGKVDMTKQNENGEHLEGVTFGVYDDAECQNAVTDAAGNNIVLVTDNDGYAISGDIQMNDDGSRKLYIKELFVTEEQKKLYSVNPTVFEIDLKPGQTVSLNNGVGIINDWLDATLSLVKQDEDGKKLSGVTFAVYTDENMTAALTDVSGSDVVLITDENGCAVSKPIDVGTTGTRKVYVQEVAMTASDSDIYEINNEIFCVELNAGQNTQVNEGNPIVNSFKTAPVKIKKSDMTTAEGVPGATIQILDESGNMVYEGVTLEDGNTEEIELRVGKYTFVETIAPDGYVLNKTVFEFTVNPDRTVTGNCEVQDKPTEWTITKSDVTTAEPLAGAEITIYDSEGKEVYKDVTNNDGTITAFRLPSGVYTFKETLAPEGYVLNEEIFTFIIDDEGNITGDNTVTDRKIKGNIKVIKTDEETGAKLPGAVFGLFSSDGKTKLAEGTTGKDGYVIFDDMEYGDYIIKELGAPVGFLMKKTEFNARIYNDGETVELTVSNSREPIVNVPKTGDTSASTPLIVCLFLMLASAGILVWLWLKKSGKAAAKTETAIGFWNKLCHRIIGG